MGAKGPEGDAVIPVIDISPANPQAPQEFLEAATNHGFVYIQNNAAGIPPKDISHMFDLSNKFFLSPLEVKQEAAISSNKAGKNHGWLSQGVEKLDPKTQKRPDVKEAFNMGEPNQNGTDFEQPLPLSLQPEKQALRNFQISCHQLCQQILRLLAVALGIDRDWFTSRHDSSSGKPSGTVFRLLYYPAMSCAYEEGIDIRAGAHSDYGSMTLLFQQRGQPGLEIKTPRGDWAAVPVDPLEEPDKPLPILVNIGDLLEDWTGGLLKSTVHRVVFPKGEEGKGDRYSIAYFCHPLDDVELAAVPSEIVWKHAEKTGRSTRREGGRVLTARDHLMERLGATYTVSKS